MQFDGSVQKDESKRLWGQGNRQGVLELTDKIDEAVKEGAIPSEEEDAVAAAVKGYSKYLIMARTLATLLDIPFAITDATTLTEAGYVGEDVENIILRLVQSADYDIARAEYGIIYVDEIDKIRKTSSNVSITRDVSGEGV